jgi:hypothetical protein
MSLAPVGDTSSISYQSVGYGDQSPFRVNESQPGAIIEGS